MPLYLFFVWFELIALLIVLINHHRIKNTYLWWFIPLLLLTNIIEWGSYFHIFTLHKSNNWIYNVFTLIEFLFYSWLYYSIIPDKGSKRIIKLLATILFFTTLANQLFLQGFWHFHSYTFMLGCIVMVSYVFLFFRQMIQHVDDESLLRQPYFWVSIGVLFFYVGQFFYFAFFQYFLIKNDFGSSLPVFHFFNNLLNILLYTCLSISFFCKPGSATT